ncbi:MAG TPA: HAMP domain-containing sensor histidine kinase [Myxococcaceae bacterium]|nr:HAMP domain-containing sensor histidine kinase [Myxococcaceae bacterium]
MDIPPGLFPALSHELRNPLSSVKMAVQTLARNPDLSDRDRRRLSIAHREVRTLERLLWLVSEAGRDSEPHLEDVPFAMVLEEAVAHIQPELEELGATLQPEPAAPDAVVCIDRSRTRGVLAPLLLSVARTAGPGTLAVPSGASSDGRWRLQLDDPRAVLEEGALRNAFVPFAFGPTRTTGLLLPALQTVMKAQGGDVEVLAPPSGGVRYALTFCQPGLG